MRREKGGLEIEGGLKFRTFWGDGAKVKRGEVSISGWG